MTKKIFIVFCLFVSVVSFGQEEAKKKFKDYISIRGYVKYMNSGNFKNLDTITTNNFFHNRVNIKGYVSDNITASVELRNRFFYGETVRMNPFFGKQIGQDQGLVDMSFVLLDKSSAVLHSTIDRMYINYATEKWDVRIGRQRINWGVNMAWNPNDLFNAYNLIDFDYQERPGSDAGRIQYFLSNLSSIEFAVRPEKYVDSSVVAALFKFNKKKYDFQILAGNYFSDIAIGGGWAGNIKDIGFKGEGTYFASKYYSIFDTVGVVSSSISFDHTLKGGIYLNASYLYNNKIPNKIGISSNFSFFTGSLSSKYLMPSKHTYFLQGSGAINPQIGAGMSVFYAQSLNLLFFMPSISIAVSNNWSLDCFGQTSLLLVPRVDHFGSSVFLRMMYSF